MKRSENAIKIYKNLYMNPNEETPEDVHHRVAKTIADTNEQYKVFKYMLDNNIFRPNTPCMINADPNKLDRGEFDHERNLVACFVLDLQDTMDSIMEMWKTAAWIYAGGGGCGIPASNLREHGSPISTGGRASGPLIYMNVIESVSNTVKSGGKSRRAANLAAFLYKHPQILEYINCKLDRKSYRAFNLSVLVDNEFMTDIMNNVSKDIDLISPRRNEVVGTVNNFEIWNKLVENAWLTGDPGLLFYDVANKFNPFPSLGDVVCSNPCGEVTQPPNTSCDLGSLNLVKFLTIDKATNKFKFSWIKFKKYICHAIDFLDNVIDKTSHPNINFKERMLNDRPLGLGIMGLSDIFILMGIRYGSEESIKLFEKICKTLTKTAFEHSIDVVYNKKKQAIPVPSEDKNHFIDLLKYYNVSEKHISRFKKTGIRNSHVTSIAPTGSISITCECSYAFEPTFALYWRKKLVDRDETLVFFNELFKAECDRRNIELSDKVIDAISENKGSIQGLNQYFPKDMQDIFVCAHDISWKDKINMQSAGQKYISLAISSTCNLPYSAPKEEVAEAYLYAWQKGLKGITVYRDGCDKDQPVDFGGTKDNSVKVKRMKRPIDRDSKGIEILTPYTDKKNRPSNLFVHIGYDKRNHNKIFEVFLRMGQQGQLPTLLLDALGRVISITLQHGVPLAPIIETIEDMGGYPLRFKPSENMKQSVFAESIVDAIAKTLEYYSDDNGRFIDPSTTDIDNEMNLVYCPVCHKKTLDKSSSGCRGGKCINPDCGYSACG